MKDQILFKVVGGDEFEKYIANVSEGLKSDIDKQASSLASSTKNVIKKQLTRHPNNYPQRKPHTGKGGILSGKYFNSLKKENMNKGSIKDSSLIYFKVGATAPHYRLAHLLEDGHILWYYGHNTHLYTKSIPHMVVGQDYANDKVVQYFEKGIKIAFKSARSHHKKG